MRTAAVLLLLLPAAQAGAQEPLETKLVITQEGRETGREEFTLRQGRGRGAPGSTLIAVARYPATNPVLKLAAALERTPESALAKFQLDVEGPNGTTVILAAGSGARLIVRTVAKGSEAGRELPGGRMSRTRSAAVGSRPRVRHPRGRLGAAPYDGAHD